MKIYLATDHAGFALKERVRKELIAQKYDVQDCGAFELDPKDDYPDFIAKAAEQVSKHPKDMAIIFGGSGQAEAMLANKFPNVRAALFYAPHVASHEVDVTGRGSTDPFEMVRLAREHNDANILSLSARFLTHDEAARAIEVFLTTPFPKDARHVRRIEKMAAIEKKLYE